MALKLGTNLFCPDAYAMGDHLKRQEEISMTLKVPVASLVLALVAFGSSCSRNEPPKKAAIEAAVPESHDDHEAAPVLEPGQLWATDVPLRSAMQRIRAAVDQAESAQAKREFTSAAAHALATTVEDSIRYMIAHCKLEPKPDAALHVLIGRMSSATTSIKKDPTSSTGVPQLRAVLHDYQSTFDHPR